MKRGIFLKNDLKSYILMEILVFEKMNLREI